MATMNGSAHPSEMLSTLGTSGGSLIQNPTDANLQDPSSDFTVISSPSSAGNMQVISFETFGSDMTLEESIQRLRELLRENHELRETVQQTNNAMRMACNTMQEWKATWERERSEVQNRYEQVKSVVVSLRTTLQEKDEKIRLLEQQLQVQGSEKSPGSLQNQEDLHSQLTASKTEALQAKEQLSSANKQRQSLSQEIDILRKGLEEKSLEMAKLLANIEIASKEKAQHERVISVLKEANGRLVIEKDDLRLMNNELTTELHNYKSLVNSSTSTSSSNNGSPPHGFVVVPGNENTSPKSAMVAEEETGPGTKLTTNEEGEMEEKRDREKEEKLAKKRKENQERTIQDLLVQMQEEKNKLVEITSLYQTTSSKLEQKESELQDKEEEMARLHSRMSAEVERLQREHAETIEVHQRQFESMQQQIGAAREAQSNSNSSSQECSTLKKQIMSLMGELQEAHSKRQAADQISMVHRDRCQELEQKVSRYEADLHKTRSEDDELIDTLRVTVKSMEQEVDRKNATIAELQRKEAQLLTDYHDLFNQFEDYKARVPDHGQMPTGQRQEYESTIDNLTAQLMVAEESLQTQTRLIKDLSKRRDELEGQVETIAVHQAQAEVFRSDFEAERKSREDAQREKEKLRADLTALQRQYAQLHDEYDQVTKTQISEMQRRHMGNQHLLTPTHSRSSTPVSATTANTSNYGGTQIPTYAQAAQFQPHQYAMYPQYAPSPPPQNTQPGPNYPYPPYNQPNYPLHQDETGNAQSPQRHRLAYLQGRDLCDASQRSQGEGQSVVPTMQSDEPVGDLGLNVANQAPTQIPSSREASPASTSVECPKCHHKAKDMDSLERHFVDCLDMDN